MNDAASTDGEKSRATGATLRGWIIDANDGIIATAGVVEGFAGAGATGSTMLVAALAAMVAGGISLGGATFAEAAAERDAALSLLEEERRQHARAPAEEFDELVRLYERKGLSSGLARQVADELTAQDALAAHAEAELGLDLGDVPSPWRAAMESGVAFAAGGTIPLLVISLAPPELRAVATFVAVVGSLILTALVLSRSGRTNPVRTVLRTILVGILAMVLTFGGGAYLGV